MSLPSDHRYKNSPPLAPYDPAFGVFYIGASNAIGVETIDYAGDVEQNQYINTKQIKKFTHDETIVNYADPWNAAGNATYNEINEGGAYSPVTALLARLSGFTDRKIIVGGGGKSARALYQGVWNKRNSSNPGDMSTVWGQYVTLAKAMMAAGVKIEMVVVDQFGRDAAIGNLDTTWYTAFEGIADQFGPDVGIGTVPTINIGAGPFPTGGTYPTWTNIRTIQKTIDANISNARNVNLDTDGLNLTLNDHYMADKLHYNTAGSIAVANGIITEAQNLSII